MEWLGLVATQPPSLMMSPISAGPEVPSPSGQAVNLRFSPQNSTFPYGTVRAKCFLAVDFVLTRVVPRLFYLAIPPDMSPPLSHLSCP